MSWRPTASVETLRERARLMRLVRNFFEDRGALEIDTPVLQSGANLDRGVHPLRTGTMQGARWLITSPEHPLKRLVTAGYGDVWSLAPVFRDGELGSRHQPEFRMLEWYRVEWPLGRIVNETIELFDAITGWGTVCEQWDYRDIMRELAGVDPVTANETSLQQALPKDVDAQGRSHDEWLDLILSTVIQPRLPTDRWTTIVNWPASQAAQAEIDLSNPSWPTAKRCEIYRGPLELANGYQECTNAEELQQRFEAEQNDDERRCLSQNNIELDHDYLTAMNEGLPPCSGIAVGFDRLVMLTLGLNDIAETLPFAWKR